MLGRDWRLSHFTAAFDRGSHLKGGPSSHRGIPRHNNIGEAIDLHPNCRMVLDAVAFSVTVTDAAAATCKGSVVTTTCSHELQGS